MCYYLLVMFVLVQFGGVFSVLGVGREVLLYVSLFISNVCIGVVVLGVWRVIYWFCWFLVRIIWFEVEVVFLGGRQFYQGFFLLVGFSFSVYLFVGIFLRALGFYF